MLAFVPTTARTSGRWCLGALGTMGAGLAVWAGCNTVAGLDGLIFVEEGAAGAGTGTGTFVECGWSPAPTVACTEEICDLCTDETDSTCTYSGFSSDPLSGVLSCPAGMPCQVSCYDHGCVNLTVVCPAQFACTLESWMPDACHGVVLQCADGPCTVNCGDTNACVDLTVRCGANDCTASCWPEGQSEVPTLQCVDASPCSCQGCE